MSGCRVSKTTDLIFRLFCTRKMTLPVTHRAFSVNFRLLVMISVHEYSPPQAPEQISFNYTSSNLALVSI